MCLYPDASVVLAGDFNKLDVGEISARTKLLPLVFTSTRGGKILDMLMTSAPHRYLVKVIRSAVRSDHRATIEAGIRDRTKTSRRCGFRRRSSEQHANLLSHLRNYDSGSNDVVDPEVAWREFYAVTSQWLEQFYPFRTISVTSRDPPFVTPELKYLIRRRNHLLRRGRSSEAAALTLNIGRLIERFDSRELPKINKAKGTKELWAAVNAITGERGPNEYNVGLSAEDLNTYFAATSTDNQYENPPLKMTVNPNHEFFNEQLILILDHLKPTAEGLDHLPAWFLRVLAPVCSSWLSRLFNLSLSRSYVPPEWKNALIHPIPKVKPALAASDYRPISVVPILSRILERLVVRGFVYPSFCVNPMAEKIRDQYAFRPSGSTTSALVDLLQKLTDLLRENEYIVLASVDFAKAFECVKHMPLMQKINLLELPDCIYISMVRYFESRGHSIRLGDTISIVSAINASIIQGSVVGPTSYVIVASDLHPKNRKNLLSKYADDTYLLIGSSMIHTATEEFENIQSWAAKNNLKIHPSKTKEMIVIGRKKSVRLPSSKQIIPGAVRVDTLRVLGVTLNQQLNMSDHIDRTLSSCASSQFA